MQRKAKIFMNNGSQAVRLPKAFQFYTREVFIRREGSDVVLSARPSDWTTYLAEAPVASADFMEGIEDLPPSGVCALSITHPRHDSPLE